MTTFEDALRKTVVGVGERYKEADLCLHEAVVEASQAIEKISNGRVKLVMVVAGDDLAGTRYQLLLEGSKSRTIIDVFFVPATGFPIRVAGEMNPRNDHQLWRSLTEKNDIRSYLTEMALNQDSLLVSRLSLMLRTEVEQTIPF